MRDRAWFAFCYLVNSLVDGFSELARRRAARRRRDLFDAQGRDRLGL